MFPSGMGFGGGIFSLFPIIFGIVFVFVFGTIIFTAVRGLKQWSYNNKQPVLTVSAKVISKRSHVSRRSHNHDGHHHHSTSTTYYVTFEVESGDRMELVISDKEYGLLAEGDLGYLTFQGTRFQGFERN